MKKASIFSIITIVLASFLVAILPTSSRDIRTSDFVFYDTINPVSGEISGGMEFDTAQLQSNDLFEIPTDKKSGNSSACVRLDYHGDPATKLDVVFIATHFYPEVGPGSKFATDVELMKEKFYSFPQFADNISKFNFYRLDIRDPEDECKEVMGNPVCSNKTKIINMAKTCPGFDLKNNDQIIIMFDKDNGNFIYGRATPNTVYMPSDGQALMIHEFGHSFARLGDEYPNGSTATIDPPYPNCASLTPGYTCTDKWGDLIGQNGVGCYQTCGASNWYRPTSLDSVMNHPAINHFCPVSTRVVDKLLSIYTKPNTNTLPKPQIIPNE